MAHYALIDDNNIVVTVNVIADDDTPLQEGRWIQTSYNANIRKNYAGIGYTYDEGRDAFIAPQPYPSWTLDDTTCQWQAPTPYPIDGHYIWDESTLIWTAQ
jgi:hypothetical protein